MDFDLEDEAEGLSFLDDAADVPTSEPGRSPNDQNDQVLGREELGQGISLRVNGNVAATWCWCIIHSIRCSAAVTLLLS